MCGQYRPPRTAPGTPRRPSAAPLPAWSSVALCVASVSGQHSTHTHLPKGGFSPVNNPAEHTLPRVSRHTDNDPTGCHSLTVMGSHALIVNFQSLDHWLQGRVRWAF